ncbi:MAG: hypothetical protein L0387_07405 [Acidobacteria bacterium]|nr:hypothetical protein [Acidobacteriota bacterium]MCI0621480.1 hypothetical protein [Acidobacteriota bacterium]MCI0724683.1 hypothetical protein [Acidobacteriota bacterium]
MKVDEIRKILAGYSERELKSVIIELYKVIPQRTREDYQIDKVLQDPTAWTQESRKPGRAGAVPDLDKLQHAAVYLQRLRSVLSYPQLGRSQEPAFQVALSW